MARTQSAAEVKGWLHMQISMVTIVVYAHSASPLIVLCVRAQSSLRSGWLFIISVPHEGEMVPFVEMEAVTLSTLEASFSSPSLFP